MVDPLVGVKLNNAVTAERDHFSIIVPVYQEAENIVPFLQQLESVMRGRHETLLIYDSDEDTTLPPARQFGAGYPGLRLVYNDIGPGVLNALRTGFKEAKGEVMVVTMADLSDDISQIEEMVALVRSGAAVAAASRYMRGGRQIGGPILKRILSRTAGVTLLWMTGIGTHDPTNNFKAYSSGFVRSIEVESAKGFEVALELTTKAHLAGLRIEEIPTRWRNRSKGKSRFRLAQWLPAYLRWYIRCVLGHWRNRFLARPHKGI